MIDYKDVIEIKKALKRGIKPMMYGDTVFDERAVLVIEDVYDVPMGVPAVGYESIYRKPFCFGGV